MVRSVERIEQELAILDQSVATIAQEFHKTYNQYLSALGQAVRQQLILAGYHLCTQGYPERFLKLSLSQRQHLQQGMRHLAKQAKTQLLERLQIIEAVDDLSSLSPFPDPTSMAILVSNRELLLEEIVLPDEEPLDEESLSQEPLNEEENQESEQTSDQTPDQLLSDPSFTDSSSSPSSETLTDPVLDRSEANLEPYTENSETLQNSQAIDQPNEPNRDQNSLQENTDPKPLHPRQIARWQERLEAAIVEELQTLSHAANRLLQQSEILPSRLPEPVLEVASRADISSEATASPPNLLNLMIETDDDDQKEPTMTQLMAIHLRLSEIEFSDSSTTIWRSKIRDLLGKLSKLGREYQKKQKEHAVAQAEAAWRSSWYED